MSLLSRNIPLVLGGTTVLSARSEEVVEATRWCHRSAILTSLSVGPAALWGEAFRFDRSCLFPLVGAMWCVSRPKRVDSFRRAGYVILRGDGVDRRARTRVAEWLVGQDHSSTGLPKHGSGPCGVARPHTDR